MTKRPKGRPRKNPGNDMSSLFVLTEESNSSNISSDYKRAFDRIRNFLAGTFVGGTRDEFLLEEILKCLFVRVYGERKNQFAHGQVLTPAQYRDSFREIAQKFSIFEDGKLDIDLDDNSLDYIDNELRNLRFDISNRDPIGDAYEIFTGSHIKGQEGQFFTPKNATKWLIEAVRPTIAETLIDPACGAGGFLASQIQFLLRGGYDADLIKEYVENRLFGIDKDKYLVRLAKGHVGLIALDEPHLMCANSLEWGVSHRGIDGFPQGDFDVLLANPPFGAKIVAASEATSAKYSLAYKWKEADDGRYVKTDKLQGNVPPQVLFVEKCVNLVRRGGRIGLVLPESIVSNKSYRHVTQYILDHCDLHAVVGMPENLFKISGKGGTHTKVCLLVLTRKMEDRAMQQNQIFMAEAVWCGNDSRGRSIEKDDLPIIQENYVRFTETGEASGGQLGFAIHPQSLVNGVLAPRYYDPTLNEDLNRLSSNHDLTRIEDLIRNNIINITTGDEVGKMAYGTGDIPFVRTSDISSWEIKIDPKHGVSEEIYSSLKRKQDVKENDILMVRDGTYLVGTCALVSKYDVRIVYQSHLLKIRSLNHEILNPHLLLALLSSPIVQRQIKTKKFTLDIIDSIGDRLKEVILPIPHDKKHRDQISSMVEKAVYDRIEARELSRRAQNEVIKS